MNPVTDEDRYGIFIVPANLFAYCFAYYNIGYYLDNSGYSPVYYDVENATSNLYTFKFNIPSTATNLAPIYFAAYTYSRNIIPTSCINSFTPLV